MIGRKKVTEEGVGPTDSVCIPMILYGVVCDQRQEKPAKITRGCLRMKGGDCAENRVADARVEDQQ